METLRPAYNLSHFSPGADRSRSRSPDRRRYSRSRSRERSYLSRRRQSRSWSRSRSRSPRRRRLSRSPYGRRSSKVDPEAESFICTVANKVREQGQQFEDVLRERESGKPKFAFLWDERVSTHVPNCNRKADFSWSYGRAPNIASIAHYCSLVGILMPASRMRYVHFIRHQKCLKSDVGIQLDIFH